MKPTPRGLALVGGGAILIVAGFAFGYPELAVVGAAALLAAAWAVGDAAWQPRLSVARSVEPDRVARGEPCAQTLVVRNASRLRAATLIAQDACGGAPVPVPLIRLRPARDTTVTYPVPTGRRGVVCVGPLSVTRRDPLGLLGSSRTHGGTARVWVHPRTHPLAAVPVGIARSLDGRVDRVPHGNITFDALREYVIGDELRRVHWRTTARVGELMVREYVDTSLPRIVVLLDDREAAFPQPDGFEEACEAAASVLVAALREDLAAELLMLSASSAIGTGDHQSVGPSGARRVDAAPLLDRLAEARLHPGAAQPEPDTGADTTGALEQAIDRLRQYRLGDTLVYLTGAARAGDLATVGALRPRYPTIVAGVFGDPAGVPATVEGLRVLAVPDAAGFAAAWDGIGRW
ncbi:DUF58 domain-containing protein [Rugosimonospora africana]|uniref:DUF58 domain-containing protein n=1 Tax=Rugosimonospora africana TaxID=556532 RepID=A0A8J3QZ29_9ACTN|nr:DUF58 domain-containing protein [Rugosimonospora africana]GIH18410.1 hypothetical protein Raf01_65820 [Rugosimonospora africana]